MKIWLPAIFIVAAWAGENELRKHFKLDTVTDLLLKMKRLAHKKVYGNREFGSDAVEDAKKSISISPQQPELKKELSPYLFEGDIFLNPKQAIGILADITRISTKEKRSRNRRFISDPTAKWDPKETIRYRFHDSLEFYAISQIISAIQYWESHTCLSFERVAENLSDDEDFIEFFKGQGCYSMIGRNGGRQGVSIGENCAKLGTVEHEVGHALGLWHEQSRPDALNFIKIERDFILPSYIGDFLQRDDEIDTLGVPYDLGSVMHYGSTAFSTDQSSKTIRTRDPAYQSTIGQREVLSFYDLQKINIAYCSDKCNGAATKCAYGGYPHPRKCNECICPNGLGGRTCETNEAPINANCGGVITVSSSWTEFTSPDFPDPGYVADQKCSWLLQAPAGQRIELQFVEDFSMLCTTTCTDYVELKLTSDLKTTGFRLCCSTLPTESFVSEGVAAVIVFRSQIADDVGFKLKARTTQKPPRTTPTPSLYTTQAPRTTVSGFNLWAEWGAWSECSRSCGGCGVKSRIRQCNTRDCEYVLTRQLVHIYCRGKRQEFSTCNLVACPLDRNCQRLIASGSAWSSLLPRCREPQCCPPFYENNGFCQGDDSSATPLA